MMTLQAFLFCVESIDWHTLSFNVLHMALLRQKKKKKKGSVLI